MERLSPSRAPVLIDDGRSAFGLKPERDQRGLWRILLLGAATVAIVAAAASSATFAILSRPQAEKVARGIEATVTLAKTVAALDARLDAIDTKAGSDLADLRHDIGEMKSASSRDLDEALGQISRRIDGFDHASSAKLEDLDQRVERDTGARASEISARLDAIEKKVSGSPPPSDPKAATPSAETKPAAPAPKLGPNVSMETTGSIERARPVLRGYVVLDASPRGALLGSRWGEQAVRIGDVLPGAGRVETIERRGPVWIVETEAGLIRPPEPRDY